MSKVVRAWLVFAVTGLILTGLIYAGIQQNIRQTANDPQIQMAEDAGNAVSAGSAPTSLINTTMVDPSKSLAPFLILTDDSGKVVASSATLNGMMPLPPSGTFDYARSNGENRFTWQPSSGVRVATVMTYHGGDHPGFAIAGRSLKEVEQRESKLTVMAALDYLGLLVGTFVILTLVL